MLALLNSLNALTFPIFQPILMIIVSKFMVHKALLDKTYLSLGLLTPLSKQRGSRSDSSSKFHLNLVTLR